MGCDVILTSNSLDDDELKQELGRLLWGYPHLVDIFFSEYADLRRRNIIKQSRTRQNDREAAPAESKKEVRPPQLSGPSTELWAHAEAEDVSLEFVTHKAPVGMRSSIPAWNARLM